MTRHAPRPSRKLALPALACLALLAAGGALVWVARNALKVEVQQLAAARVERSHARERLTRIADEEREVREKVELYRRLKELHILGEERRLEWVDAIASIRAQRELPDLRFQIERQKLLSSAPGKSANVDFNSSTMTVELGLLHEGDLLRFLRDLRASGNAYYAIQRCSISRSGQEVSTSARAARLRASCQIDLITILDRAAGT